MKYCAKYPLANMFNKIWRSFTSWTSGTTTTHLNYKLNVATHLRDGKDGNGSKVQGLLTPELRASEAKNQPLTKRPQTSAQLHKSCNIWSPNVKQFNSPYCEQIIFLPHIAQNAFRKFHILKHDRSPTKPIYDFIYKMLTLVTK